MPPQSPPTCDSTYPCTLVAPYTSTYKSVVPSGGSCVTNAYAVNVQQTSSGLTEASYVSYIAPTSTICSGGINSQLGFYSGNYIAGAGSDRVTVHWSYTGKLYELIDCTGGGTGPTAGTFVAVAVNAWDVTTSSWAMTSNVSTTSVSHQISSCASGVKFSWSQFPSVLFATSTATIGEIQGDTYEIFSYFQVDASEYILPYGTGNQGAGSCAGLTTTSNGCYSSSTSGSELNNITVA